MTGRRNPLRARRAPKWIAKRSTLAIHELLLAAHGGAPGFIDEALLDSALAAPLNHFEYGQTNVLELAAIYAYAITQNHPFVDGNKRVAFTVAVTFLERNGFRLNAPEPEAVQIVLDLSARRATAGDFALWLRENSRRVPAARTKAPARKTPKRK